MRKCDLNNRCLGSWHEKRRTVSVDRAKVITSLINDWNGRLPVDARKHICRKQDDLDVATVARLRRNWAMNKMTQDRVPQRLMCSVLQEEEDRRKNAFLQNQLPSHSTVVIRSMPFLLLLQDPGLDGYTQLAIPPQWSLSRWLVAVALPHVGRNLLRKRNR